MISNAIHNTLEQLRYRLARADHMPLLALLGVLTGCATGGVIIGFRITVESMQRVTLNGLPEGRFEDLPLLHQLLLPLLGGLLIGLILERGAKPAIGVVHVIERLAYHQAYLPLRNALYQVMGAAMAIASGHSVGREGPAVHIGATTGSQLSHLLRLPANTSRTLVACGIAAAIGASFNTPLAGVIFAMEVVLLEYTISSFTPIILASVSATLVSQLYYGDSPAFHLPAALELNTINEIPAILLLGLLCGAASFLFSTALIHTSQWLPLTPIWIRTTIAGGLIGAIAMVYPEVMGIGYDTVNATLAGELGIGLLLGIGIAKMLATAISIGLGIPGGLIGPTLVMGATLGGAWPLIVEPYLSTDIDSVGLYAILGMGAMMGATLQAPLSALIALLELTANPKIILPGMLVIVTAGLISRQLFRPYSIFMALLKLRGLDYRHDPFTQSMRRLGVTAAMSHDFVTVPRELRREAAEEILARRTRWLYLQQPGLPHQLLESVDLSHFLLAHPDETDIRIDQLPAASRIYPPTISTRATLQEALEQLDALDIPLEHQTLALLVTETDRNGNDQIYGILTQREIERYSRYNAPN